MVQNGQIRQAENAGLGLKHTDSSGVKRMDPSSEECVSWCRTYKSIRCRRHGSMMEIARIHQVEKALIHGGE